MQATAFKSATPVSGSVMIRRVIRMGGHFICGICKRPHRTPDRANNCLSDCWDQVRSGVPYMPFRRMRTIEYACIYCLRSYKTTSLAVSCAEDCLNRMHITAYDGSVMAPRRAKRTWGNQLLGEQTIPVISIDDRSNSHPVATPQPQPIAAPIEPPSTPSPTVTAAPPLASAASSSDIDDTSPEGRKLRKPKDRTKKFIRAGAKYECIVCQTKYFTKEEVDACFDGHPD